MQGIMEVKFSEPLSSTVFHADLPTKDTFGDQPLETDPLDKRYIDVRESDVEHEVADEG